MKKFILLIALSVFFYSVPGYTMPGGEKEKGAAPAKYQRGKESTRARLNFRPRGTGVNPAEQLPSPSPHGQAATYGWSQEEAPLGNQGSSLIPVQVVTQYPHGLKQVGVVTQYSHGPAAPLYGPAEEAPAPVPPEAPAPDSPKAPAPEGEEEERILKHLAGSHQSPLPGEAEGDQLPDPAAPLAEEAAPLAEEAAPEPDGGLPAESPEEAAAEAEENSQIIDYLASQHQPPPLGDEEDQSPRPVYGPALPDGWPPAESPKAPAPEGEEDPPLGWDAGGQSPRPVYGPALPDGWPPAESPKAPAPEGEEDPPLGWDAGGQSPPPVYGPALPDGWPPAESPAPDSPKAPTPEGEENSQIIDYLASQHQPPPLGWDAGGQSPPPVYGPALPDGWPPSRITSAGFT